MGRKTTDHWGTRVGLILAMAGNAVGLGNFLRFPAQAIQNGGGAFLIPYLVCFLVMGLPLLWVEWAIGRFGGQFGHHSTPGMFDRMGRYRWLKYIGVFGLFTNLTVAAYYCYIESWTLAYVVHSILGTFSNTDPTMFFARYLGVDQNSFLVFPLEALFFFGVVLALNLWILSRGLSRGVELAAKIGMPLLILFAVVLMVKGLCLEKGTAGVIESPWVGLNFVWQPKTYGLLNPSTWLAAAGQVFFTLSVGMGSIHCYAAYLRHNQDIALNAATAGWMNEFIEVIFGSAILIPIAVAYIGLSGVQSETVGGSGFGLAFLALPKMFLNWGWWAPFAGMLWFGLLFFAGITSSLAMMQPVSAFLEDEFMLSKNRSVLFCGLCLLVLGLVCVCLYPAGSFDEFDYWSGTFSLVVFALLEVIVFSYVFGMERGWAEITRSADLNVPKMFRWIIRYVTPSILFVIFFSSLVKPDGPWFSSISKFLQEGSWPLATDSVLGKIFHIGEGPVVWFDQTGKVTRVFVQDMTRLLLTALFIGCFALVWFAFRKRNTKESENQ